MSYYNRGGKRKSHPKKRRQKHKNKNKTNNLPAAKEALQEALYSLEDAKIEQPISSQSPDNIQPQHNNNNNINNINNMQQQQQQQQNNVKLTWANRTNEVKSK
eukprot:82604_1